MKQVLHMFAAIALLASTASALSAGFDTVFCNAQSDAVAIKDAAMQQPSLQLGADESAAMAVIEPLIASGTCQSREFADLSTAGFTAHPESGVAIGIVPIDNGYAVAMDFLDL
ncbi:hypothetical protein [Mesorhizobium sp.]|uniref:hypothetical protein n=1 Tax=Mesorhizobium sp. TaxID=1871066 RepID=UPI000FE743AF|nr:hypothetical protein [Mesorhizobium sp.]RWQ58818.1 MAG: hypothetical protein EOS83_12495 [Mesorhizobium sp.]